MIERTWWIEGMGAWIWHVSWQASLLAFCVVCLQRLLRRWLSPRARHALWLVVLARLVLPWIPASPWSPYAFFERRSDPHQKIPTTNADWAAEPDVLIEVAAAQSAHPVEVTTRSASPASSSGRSGVPAVPPFEPRSGPRFSVAMCWLLIWACGCVMVVAWTAGRWCRFLRSLRASATAASPELEELLTACAVTLGLRRSVRLFITASVPAPAVMGCWRPIVLVPPWIVDALSLAELRLVFLHELMHVRRQDVVVTWLVEVLRGLHWFNPWLWRCFTWMRRARELACDQCVLRCLAAEERRRYGHTILRVLELVSGRSRGFSYAVPTGAAGLTFWTSKELPMLEERIRLAAQGSVRPRGRQLVLGTTLVVLVALGGLTDAQQPVLPKPTSVPAAPTDAARADRRIAPSAAPGEWNAPRTPATAPRAAIDPTAESPELQTVAYPMNEILAIFRSAEPGISTPRDKPVLPQPTRVPEEISTTDSETRAEPLPLLLPRARKAGETRDAATSEANRREREPKRSAEEFVRSAAGTGSWDHTRTIDWREDNLLVTQTVGAHERIREALGTLQRTGLQTLVLQCEVVEATDAAVREAGIDWHVLPAGPDARTDSELAGGVWTQRSVTLPALYSRLDADESSEFVRAPGVHRLSAPKLAVLNGQVACVQIGQEVPFKTLDESGQTSVGVATCGQTCSFQPVLLSERDVQLNCRLDFSELAAMEEDLVAIGGETVAVQVPEVRSKRISASTRVRMGKTLALRGPKSKTNTTTIVLIKVGLADTVAPSRPGSTQVTTAAAEEPDSNRIYAKVYQVGDLVLPVPDGNDREPASAPRPIEFQPLVDLVTATIAPESWEAAGGQGTIQAFEANLSLVVSQNDPTHKKIAELFAELRRMMDTQVVLSARLIRVSDDKFGELARMIDLPSDSAGHWVLGSEATGRLLTEFQNSVEAGLMELPRITLFNGQAATLRAGDDWPGLQLSAKILGHRDPVQADPRGHRVRLRVAMGDEPRDVLKTTHSVDVDIPQSVLLEITSQVDPIGRANDSPVGTFLRESQRRTSDQPRTFCLITPTVVVQTAEVEQAAVTKPRS